MIMNKRATLSGLTLGLNKRKKKIYNFLVLKKCILDRTER